MGNSVSLSKLTIEDYRLMNMQPHLPVSKKIYEKMLSKIYAQYPYLESNAIDAMCVADNNMKDCPLVYINDQFEAMTYYPKEEVIGRNCRFLGGKYTSKKAISAIKDAVEQGKELEVELLNYRKDGVPFLNHFVLLPLWASSKKMGKKNEKPSHFIGLQLNVSILKLHRTAPENWTVPEVAHFLEELDLGDYALPFVEAGVTGRRLLKMTENDLKTLGIDVEGDRSSLLKRLESLRPSGASPLTRYIFNKDNYADISSFSNRGDENDSNYESVHARLGQPSKKKKEKKKKKKKAAEGDNSAASSAATVIEGEYYPVQLSDLDYGLVPGTTVNLGRSAEMSVETQMDQEMFYEALLEGNRVVETLINEGEIDVPSYEALAQATNKAKEETALSRAVAKAMVDDDEQGEEDDEPQDDTLINPQEGASSSFPAPALPRSVSLWSANNKKDPQVTIKLLFADATVVLRVRKSISLLRLEKKAKKALNLRGLSLKWEGRTLDEKLWAKLREEIFGTIKLTVMNHIVSQAPNGYQRTYSTTYSTSSSENEDAVSKLRENRQATDGQTHLSASDLPAPLIIANEQGSITFANPLAQELFGLIAGPDQLLREVLPSFDFSNRQSRLTFSEVTIGPRSSSQTVDGLETGSKLHAMVSIKFEQTRTVICLLPLSAETRKIICASSQ